MYSHILVPLDGSTTAEQVLPYVEIMATAFQAKVTLVKAYPVIPLVPESKYIDNDIGPKTSQELALGHLTRINRSESTSYLRKIAMRLAKSRIEVTHEIHHGDAADVISQAANDDPNTLVAMSTHGRSGLSRWSVGSVAEKTLHSISNPLFLIRSTESVEELPIPELKTIIVPLDGSQEAEQALRHVTAFGKSLNLNIQLINVTTSPTRPHGLYQTEQTLSEQSFEIEKQAAEKYMQDISRRSGGMGVSLEQHQILVGDPSVQIIDFAQQTPGSMVLMTTHGRTGLQRWMFGSVADRVVRNSGGPVCLIRIT